MVSILREFSSYSDFLAGAQLAPVWPESLCQSRIGTKAFTHTESWNEALEIASTGWPEGRAQIVKGLDDVTVLQQGCKELAYSYDVAGAFPDVARFVAGAVDCMVSLGDQTSKRKPIVKMIINLSASAVVSHAQIINRGVAILSEIDTLEDAGFSVELECIERVRDKHNSRQDELLMRFPLKRAGEAFDFDRMAFVIAHPSFLRRLMFAIYEQHEELRESMGYTYGKPADLKTDEIEAGSCYFGCIRSENKDNYSTLESALKHVRAQVQGAIQQLGMID